MHEKFFLSVEEQKNEKPTKDSLEQSPLVGQSDRFVTILHVQLLVDAAGLGPDGINRDHQFGSDFGIGEASRKPLQDFALASA